jgi:hypothetical protein
MRSSLVSMRCPKRVSKSSRVRDIAFPTSCFARRPFPERLVAYRYENGSPIQTEFDTLALTATESIPFSTRAIFGELRDALSEPA